MSGASPDPVGPVVFTITVPDMADDRDRAQVNLILDFSSSRDYLTIELAACAGAALLALRECAEPDRRADLDQALVLITGTPSQPGAVTRGGALQ